MTQLILRTLLALTLSTAWTPWLVSQEIDLNEFSAWQLVNVTTTRTEYQSQPAIQILAAQSTGDAQREHLAILGDLEFENGTIELELAGKPRASAGGMARGFIGVAFRVRKDAPENYEAFYLRPTNGRAEDHSTSAPAIEVVPLAPRVDAAGDQAGRARDHDGDLRVEWEGQQRHGKE